jgi:RNA polymerase sigma-70 factor, ECF subfamily
MPAPNRATRVVGERWLSAEAATALVRHAQVGTAAALDALLAALRPRLYAYFARRLDAPEADDLAQRALLIITREYRRIAPESAARWLVTVARNVLRDEHRRSARAAGRYASVLDAATIAAPESVAALTEYHELARAVIGAAHGACTASLRAVVLGVVRGLEVSEIAHLEGISECAVRVRLARARAVLRRELTPFREANRPRAERAGVRPPR